MRQSRVMSLAEAAANVVVGYAVAALMQVLLFPVFGLFPMFGLVLIVRSFALRRPYECLR